MVKNAINQHKPRYSPEEMGKLLWAMRYLMEGKVNHFLSFETQFTESLCITIDG